ncbi:MAG: hypothetical protein A7316_00740 [Candidatus Altiarchaeales archaeon WOR_SM1_86-2]|nr:MAG: hypothetical protein A7315_05340 [Candidatus Altiarchaeales archaeon WOR_SM1_79]ODS39034.1 MAG: hypothetical protein A7316_00740 [Candidatus Altiarchaeales archaeon WOR_SM1_86-2]
MSEDYYSYTKKLFRKAAPFYGVVDILVSGVRHEVVDLTNAGNGSKILDVCTGTGSQALAFAKRGYDVVGIDLSEDMLKVAGKKNRYGGVEFKVADATDIPFEDNEFDVSVISFALHDMPRDVREKVLAEINRVTKPKGDVVIVDYALPENKISRFLVYHLTKLYETRYYPEFIKSDLKALIRKYGIGIEKEIPVMFGSAKILKGINEK